MRSYCKKKSTTKHKKNQQTHTSIITPHIKALFHCGVCKTFAQMTGAGYIHNSQETKKINKHTLAPKHCITVSTMLGLLKKFRIETVDSFYHFNEEKKKHQKLESLVKILKSNG